MSREKFNEVQMEIVKEQKENLIVVAPAGTGKTSVMAERIKGLIDKGVPSERILCLTFTNKAANDMKKRIEETIGYEHQLEVKTIHSFCYQLISFEKEKSHYAFPISILDEADAKDIVARICIAIGRQQMLTKEYLMSKEMTQEITRACYFIENIKKYSLSLPTEARYNYAALTASYLNTHEVESEFLRKYGAKLLKNYSKYLMNNNYIDFSDIVVEATYLLEDPEILNRHRNRYDYFQVDEMQDTSLAEYSVIKHLARGKNIALFGDFNQTIYEWRGSQPQDMLKHFKKYFKPKEFEMTTNYRSTQTIINAANSFVSKAKLKNTPCYANSSEIGDPIRLIQANYPSEEYSKIAAEIKSLSEEERLNVAILTRTNAQSIAMSDTLTRYGVPCLKVEDTKLFRKKEVKDMLAIFHLLSNNQNAYALEKILTHSFLSMDDGLLMKLKTSRKEHMSLYDWVSSGGKDPYTELFNAYEQNEIVVMDVESTGLDTTRDDIIQIAAVRYGKDGVQAEMDILVKTDKEVGNSFYVHGISNELLEEKGLEPLDALSKLLDFTNNKIIIGHNVTYDINIIESTLYRLGLPQLNKKKVYDTLDLARKLYPNLGNHKLCTLAEMLKTEATPNHDAFQDILATAQLLPSFVAQLKDSKADRLKLIKSLYPQVKPFEEMVQKIIQLLEDKMPNQMVIDLLNLLDFQDSYSSQQMANLREFCSIIKMMQDPNMSIKDNILKVLAFASLHPSEIDQSEFFKNRIPIITIHQAKGLEFDNVYLVGCNGNVFPSYRSVTNGKVEEEMRLFYVALTRAKKQLSISYNMKNGASEFISMIDQKYLTVL